MSTSRRLVLALALLGSGILAGASARADAPPKVQQCSLRMAQTQVMGHLDKAVVRHLTRARLAPMCPCTRVAGSGGETITIHYIVGTTGDVVATQVVGTPASPMAASCMAKLVETWTFPSGRLCGMTHVEQSFIW